MKEQLSLRLGALLKEISGGELSNQDKNDIIKRATKILDNKKNASEEDLIDSILEAFGDEQDEFLGDNHFASFDQFDPFDGHEDRMASIIEDDLASEQEQMRGGKDSYYDENGKSYQDKSKKKIDKQELTNLEIKDATMHDDIPYHLDAPKSKGKTRAESLSR